MIHNLLLKFLFTLIPFVPLLSNGQEAPKIKIFDKGIVSTSFMDGKFNNQQKVPGAVYFDDKWHKGKIVMKDGSSMSGIYIRYDLLRSVVEVREDDFIKAHPTRFIKGFSWYNFYIADSLHFITLEDHELRRENFDVIYETVLSGEPMSLLATTKISIQEPNYLPALDLGNPERKVINQKKYFMYDGSTLISIEKQLDRNLKAFHPFEKEVYFFAKEYKLKCKREADLKAMVIYFNRLSLLNLERTSKLYSTHKSSIANDLQ